MISRWEVGPWRSRIYDDGPTCAVDFRKKTLVIGPAIEQLAARCERDSPTNGQALVSKKQREKNMSMKAECSGCGNWLCYKFGGGGVERGGQREGEMVREMGGEGEQERERRKTREM